jgi:hypothetical protein
VDGAKIDYKAKYAASQQAIRDNYANFEVPPFSVGSACVEVKSKALP